MSDTRIEAEARPRGPLAAMRPAILWNLASLGFLALAGLALNIVIGRYYGPETLGVFNVTFAIYIFTSQIAVFGLQLAVLQAISVANHQDMKETAGIVYSGLFLCLAIATAVTTAAAFATPLLVSLFPRVPDLGAAWLVAVPGLVFFAANKYLLGAINGLQHMRAFAVFQAARFGGIICGLAIFVVVDGEGRYLPIILTMAETFLFFMIISYVMKAVPPKWPLAIRSRLKRHFDFGFRVFPAGLVAELNTRVDVLMLAALVNDRAAGIYTVAALVYEAALQAVVVIRNVINPKLARDIQSNATKSILEFSRLLFAIVTSAAVFGAGSVILLFSFFLSFVFPGQEFQEASKPLFWLMAIFCFTAAPLCYSLILSQAGKPFWQSIVMIIILGANITLSAIMIPLLGISGAAISVGLSNLIGGALIIGLSRFLLGIRLFC